MGSSPWSFVIRVCGGFLAVAASPAVARTADPAGIWELKAEGKTVLVVKLAHDPKAPQGWSGEIVSPTSGYFTQAHTVGGLGGPPLTRKFSRVAVDRDVWRLTVPAKKAGEEPDVYTFHPLSANSAEYGVDVPGFEPLILTRARPGAQVATGWEASHDYRLDEPPPPTDPEMTTIFEADQADRKNGPAIDWSKVGPRDEARRVRTKELLDAGKLKSGEDFLHAAFVFQHGSTPADYLLAHTLAVVAAAKGRRDASWIAAATLDRYLQSIGQKQIYGTQFSIVTKVLEGHELERPPASQEPFDRTLVPDSLREALGVPPLRAQEQRRQELEKLAAGANDAKN